jgi:hypothetical protein
MYKKTMVKRMIIRPHVAQHFLPLKYFFIIYTLNKKYKDFIYILYIFMQNEKVENTSFCDKLISFYQKGAEFALDIFEHVFRTMDKLNYYDIYSCELEKEKDI